MMNPSSSSPPPLPPLPPLRNLPSSETTRLKMFQSVFDPSDLFHFIVMSGFLQLDHVLGLRLVCKLWNEHIMLEGKGWNAFQYHVLIRKFHLSLPSEHKVPSSLSLSSSSSYETIKLFFSIAKACNSVRTGLAHPYFCAFREGNVFQGETNHTMMMETRMDFEEDLAGQFLSEKFYRSMPHVTPMLNKELNVVLDYIPSFLWAKICYWANLNHGQWFNRKDSCQQQDHDNNQHNFVVSSILWTQRIFTYSYDEFNFDMVIHFEGSFFASKKRMIEKLFLVDAVELTIQKEAPIPLDPTIYDKKFNYVLTSSCFETDQSHDICKVITTFGEFKLRYIDTYFLNHYRDSNQLVKDPVPKGLDAFFNSELQQTLFQFWSKGLLHVKFIRNFFVRLLLALAHKRHDWYSLSFHDSIQESCPNMKATNGVIEWFHEFVQTKKQEYSEIWHTFINDHEVFQGFHEGEKIQSYLVILMLKPNMETQSCPFQLVKYLFYEYKLDGEILS
ncbi:hypothetical protein FDP41_013668 [Naegleria fowleri]|uniref:Uncharacterized protein n=1 Tax=Naegleria fowleri TaxID=5763 RepID=A0A6A5C1M7_NAEFO|nr:uncharacterized protein FDP41_013668 [Naegleria fowleri]KAF0980454.1 hypothetical protein FDP41_013668 [Naegleria fowleri]